MDDKILMSELIDLERKQIELRDAFLKEWPNIMDWKFYIDVPKNGLVTIKDGTIWEFKKHGTGLIFECKKNGVIVDFDSNFHDHGEAFNLFRFMSFLESKIKSENFVSDKKLIKNWMNNMEKIGVIESLDNIYGMYKLIHH